MSCERRVLSNSHYGNTFSEIKYALHCASETVMEQTIDVLVKIGFEIRSAEADPLRHTFLCAPSSLVKKGSFHYVLILADDGNDQRVYDSIVQGVHIGFRTSREELRKIEGRTCPITKTVRVEKPDESSLFIQLPCGEVVEIAGVDPPFPLRTVIKAGVSVALLFLLWAPN